MNDLTPNITSYINESVTVCDTDLENSNEKIDLLNFKTKLLSAKTIFTVTLSLFVILMIL
ncbi:hypothetical protein BK011_07820 [Tenericutes bacterium MZ-XQ]|nr:hypothetical protein BK011_07820 [Tenericutes bacterium MZ-XQ]